MTTQQIQVAAPAYPSVRILGSRVHLLSAARTVDHIERWIGTRERTLPPGNRHRISRPA